MKLFLKILLVLFCVSLSAAILFFLLVLYSITPREYTKPKDYQKVYNLITDQKMITHFPKSIPKEATEIKFWSCIDETFHGETLMLEFKIDKSYIDKEFKSNTFINPNDKPGMKQKIYYMPDTCSDPNNYTYYVIKNEDNLHCYREYFPYHNGIGIDLTNSKILYYYIQPSD